MIIGLKLLLPMAMLLAEAEPPKQQALTPQETLASFRLPEGLEIELVASEPLVTDPVAISFDEQGRLFVVEYRDYPVGPPEGQPPLSRIRLLEDTDGDGQMDKSHIFAEQLSFAQGIMAWNGGLLVTKAPEVVFMKDTDGDNKADQTQVLFTGFNPGNPQLRTAHPRWGMDNWVYLTNGLSGGEVSNADGQQKIDINRLDFRFNPLTMEFQPATGLGQFGNTFDDWGNRFFCSNRNPTMYAVLPFQALNRNPYAFITNGYEDVAPAGGDAKVYPTAKTLTTAFSHTGTHTAACGVTVYRGDLLGPDFSNNVFVCEPTGYLVTRSTLKPKGVSFDVQKARPKVDFLTSTDTWFRPVSCANGPDGALYVVDMYRAVIEHPQYMKSYFPDSYIESLNFREGEDRGRIYRIRPTNAEPRPYVAPKTPADLVALLSDPNGWRRLVGQRLLVERKAEGAEELLQKLVSDSDNTLARAHALWILESTGKLSDSQLTSLLQDSSPRIQEFAVQIAASRLKNEQVLERVTSLATSPDDRVRLQVALALGATDAPQATAALVQIAKQGVGDTWFPKAVLTSVEKRSAAVLAGLLADEQFRGTGDPAHVDFVTQLASVTGARGEVAELADLFETITAGDQTGVWWQTAAITGLARGLPRHNGSLGRTNLAKLISSPPEELKAPAQKVQNLLAQTTQLAVDSDRSVADRIAAVKLLGYQRFEEVEPVLPKLLGSDQPRVLQLACIEAMQNLNPTRVSEIILDAWDSLGPDVRRDALDLMLRRGETIRILLTAMNEGTVNPAVVSLDQRTRLLRSGDKPIQELANKLFGGGVSANRKEVIAKYQAAVDSSGDAVAGQKAFKKICAACHRIDGEGHEVGPDISDVRNKTREQLLHDILDPNGAVEPRWTDYAVATVDGRILSGLLVSQTDEAIVLRMAEGKQEIVPRADIETLRATGKSIMPEGIEKDLSVQELTDLLSFLKDRK